MTDTFKPKPLIRNPKFQTIYSSIRLKKKDKSRMASCARKMIIDGAKGEKLLAFCSKDRSHKKGTVLIIHGWEGSSNSSYVRSTGGYLFDHGFDIIRLNLRDHGDSHHLNKGLFKSTLIDETFGAIKNAAALNQNNPFYVIGYSLGGNFALRISIKAGKSKIKNLKHVVAISPVINPTASMNATDKTSVIKKYFLKKWIDSMLKKQSIFPELYNFSGINKYKTLDDMIGGFVPLYTEFKNKEEYYKKYDLRGNAFKELKIPTSIITSSDDPIIPVEDFYRIKKNKNLKIEILPYGGHCGFFDLFPYRVWYHKRLLEIFSS